MVKLISNSNLAKLKTLENFALKRNNSNDLDNYWISGFAEGDASFQIKVVNRANRIKPEIRLRFQADQKTNSILLLLQAKFEGYLGYRKSQDTWYFETTSFVSADKVVKYFDCYPLYSSKYLNYLKWKEAAARPIF